MSPTARPRGRTRLRRTLERGWSALRTWLKRNGEAFYLLLRILLLLWQFLRMLGGARSSFPRARAIRRRR